MKSEFFVLAHLGFASQETVKLQHQKKKKRGVRRELELLSLKEKERGVIVSLLPPDAVSLLLSSSIACYD